LSAEAPRIEIRKISLKKRLIWGLLVGVSGGALAFGMSFSDLFQSFESKTLDWRQVAFPAPRGAVEKVAVVLIDDPSIETLLEIEGVSWPWPRDLYEPIILFLKEAGAKAVVFDLIFADPQKRSDSDKIFAQAAKDFGRVSFACKLVPWQAKAETEAPTLAKASIQVEGWKFPPRKGLKGLILPIPELVEAAQGVGFVNAVQDPDNTLRRADLVYPYPDASRPVASIALEALRSALGRDLKAAVSGRELLLGNLQIPLGRDGRLLVRFYGKEGTVPVWSAASLLRSYVARQEGKPVSVDPKVFKDRIVFLGTHAAGMEDIVPAPVSTRFPGTEYWATACANILGGDFLREMGDGGRLSLLLVVGALGGLVTFWLWEPVPAAVTAVILYGAYFLAACLTFRSGLVIDLFFPAVALGAVFTSATVTGYFLEGRQKRQVSRAFGQYLSPEVIRDLMKNPEGFKLGGETREITVYFSDIEGFSTFSEKMPAEDLVPFLNAYLTPMTDIILDHRGVVDKYIGDAVVAFWNAPVALYDHAREACWAVLEQQKALLILNARFEAEGRPPIKFRVGLNMGQAKVGNMGSTRRFNYTAMGDTVNLASRLEGANKFFGTNVMMTEAVRAAAGDAVVARRLGNIQVVGKSVPAMVYELLAKPEDFSAAGKKRLERYHEALQLLEAKKTAAAARELELLLKEGPDPVVEVFWKKCQELLKSGANWDGIWVLKSKG
jgi:adenylate cyclase